MIDERFYCTKCIVPVEYVPELERYTCGVCEGVFGKREVLPGVTIQRHAGLVLDRILERLGEKLI